MADSALIIELPWAEPVAGPWRHGHDPVSHRGIPAHVTILHPFRSPDVIDEGVRTTLAGLAAAVDGWRSALVEVSTFPDAVWLRPEPDDGFHRLAASVFAAFPDCPPYGGRFDGFRPHLTLGQSSEPGVVEALRDEIASDLAAVLPIAGPVVGLSLFVSADDRHWTRDTVFPFS